MKYILGLSSAMFSFGFRKVTVLAFYDKVTVLTYNHSIEYSKYYSKSCVLFENAEHDFSPFLDTFVHISSSALH